MKTDRLLGIAMTVLREGKTTAPQLARKFEVSRRTISRDVEALCRAGIPIVTEQGSGGGISIAAGYRVDAALLTREELEAILAGVRGIDSVSSAPRESALRDKLQGSGRIAATDGVLIDLASHYRGSLTEKIDRIRRAIRERRLIRFTYYAEKGESERCVEPYFLLFKWTDWYVYGYCRQREDFRLFKLTRLWDCRLLDEPFSPRDVRAEDVDPDQYFTGAVQFSGLFEERMRYRLIEEYGPQSFARTEDGRLLLSVGFTSETEMLRWALSFGDALEVLKPCSLRREIARQARGLCAREERKGAP